MLAIWVIKQDFVALEIVITYAALIRAVHFIGKVIVAEFILDDRMLLFGQWCAIDLYLPLLNEFLYILILRVDFAVNFAKGFCELAFYSFFPGPAGSFLDNHPNDHCYNYSHHQDEDSVDYLGP